MNRRLRRPAIHRSARNMVKKLIESLVRSGDARNNRPIRFEPLERRELMAIDFFESSALAAAAGLAQGSNSAFVSSNSNASTMSMSAGNLQAEGENANDLVAFAKALTAANVKFYGADWCPFCNEQKGLFKEGALYLPFIEVTNPDRTLNATGQAQNITTYPTWVFANGQRVTGVQTLAQLSQLSGVAIPQSSTPTIVEIPNQTVLYRSPLHIPVNTYDPNGGPLTIEVTSSNPSAVTAELITNTESLRMTIDNYGEMVYRLFKDEAPRPVSRIEQLVNSGFYNETSSNKITFHRVIDNFVIQAGDPTGTGSGGSSLDNFDDQFNLNLQHNRTGVLSYAKSTDDTNDSQFFITEGPQRHLDFNHSIFGQLVEGDSVRDAISRTAVNSSNKPINDVVINKMEIFNDNQNGLIRLKAQGVTGTSTITVTVRNSTGQTFTRTFVATAAADTANGAPFLNDITVPPIAPGQTVTIQLSSQDKEGDTVYYDATRQGTVGYQFNIDHNTGLLSVTAPQNFTGSFDLSVGVRQVTTPTTSDTFDTEMLRFVSAATVSAPTGIDLVASTDTGSSDSDNITSAGTMQFVVSGTTSGATVKLMVGSQVVGTAVATGSTTTITTALIAGLGNGTQSIVATQTLNSVTSAASPALAVTFDNLAPAAIASNLLPSQANVDSLLSYDLTHPEEGNGLRYTLENGPAGLTVNATTGVLSWTPTSAQIGPQTATLRLTDLAGNSVTQALAITVADAAKIRVSLQAVDVTTGAVLTSLALNQEFNLKVIVQDLRTAGSGVGEGVFSAYMDIVYDSTKVEVVGTSPITYDPLFANGQTATTTTAGLIDEAGAFSSLTAGPGRAAQTVMTIRMKAKASGQASFSTNPGETASRGFAIFKEDNKVPDSLVSFGTLSVPVAQNFTAANDTFSANEDSSNNSLNVLANDTITAGSNTTLTIQTVSTPSKGGSASISNDGKTIVYTPAANYNGAETFTYVVRDQSGATQTATVSMQVQAVNDPPVATADTITTVKSGDTDVFIDVLSNDTDGPDTGETLTVSAVGTPSQGGTVRLASGNNGVLYTPKAGFVGTETFTYTLSDGNGGTATGTVTVNVGPAVPPPTVVGESKTVAEDSASVEYDVLSNDTPAATGDTLTVIKVTSQNGTTSISSDSKKISYAPKANFNGTDLVVYTVRSSNGGTALGTMTMTVTAVNDAPNAIDDNLSVLSAPNQSVDVLKNDTDVDSGDTRTITAVTQPSTGNGTVQIASDGKSILYSAPSTTFTGTVTFTYTIKDAAGLSDTANVTLTVFNYVPRDVGVVTSLPVQGVNITVTQLDGLSSSGTVSQATLLSPQQSGNQVKVSNVGPGTYQFSVGDLPFFNQVQKSVVVSSNLSDTSSIASSLVVGARDARYVDIRDFNRVNLQKGMTIAVSASKQTAWYDGSKDWRNLSNIQVTLNNAATQLTISAKNASNQNVSASISTTDPKVELRGIQGDARLFRIRATPSDLTFTPVTSSSSTASGEGEGESTGFSDYSAVPLTSNSSSLPSASSSAAATQNQASISSQSIDTAMGQYAEGEQHDELESAVAPLLQGSTANSAAHDSAIAQVTLRDFIRKN